MIRNTVIGGLTALLLWVHPAMAFDPANMSDSETAAFRDAVRAYLLDNPEVLMEAIGILEARQAAEQAAAEEGLVARHAAAIFDDGHSWVGGNPEGDITLVEFMDYRCGFCRRAHPEVAELVSSDGNIRKIVKEFPILGEESVAASRFAISVLQTVGPDAYKAVNDILIVHRGTMNEAAFDRIARAQGLDPEPILAHMNDDSVTEVIRQNRALAQALNINGTPSFVFSDQLVRGYVPLDDMRSIVSEIRAQ